MVLRAVIFDLGGTLIYYCRDADELIRAGHQAMTEYLAGQGFDVKLEDVVQVSDGIYNAYESFVERVLIELNSHILYSAILYQLGISEYSSEDLITGSIESFYSPIFEDYHVYEDVKVVLSKLRKKGLKLGLVTNNHSTEHHLRLLKKFDLKKFFDSIVVSSELGIRKPHKRIFLHCLKMLGIDNESSIFVGDNPFHDIKGAKNAGIRCIWVKRRDYEAMPAEPDWTVESIRQAEEVITTLVHTP